MRLLKRLEPPVPFDIPAEDLQRREFWPRDATVIDNACGVCLTHIPTGLQAACAEERTLLQNYMAAYDALVDKVRASM